MAAPCEAGADMTLAATAGTWTPGRTLAIVERNFMTYKHAWTVVLAAVIEPMLYLLSIGIGVGALVGTVPGIDVRYPVFVGPALLATAAMNSASNQTSFGVFARLKTENTYDAILPTPVSVTDIAFGEVTWAVLNGLISSTAFLAVIAALGYVVSPWALLAIPGSLLIGFAFASAGLATMTYLRDFSDFQLIQLVMLPMFLFATTFYPITTYPAPLRPFIEALPLYQSIELVREPALGQIGWGLLGAAAYLLLFGVLSLWLATRRMARALLH
jgi:lipooligosaccharide transport system permease protein